MLSTPQEHSEYSLWRPWASVGDGSPAEARTCYPQHREASRWFCLSAAFCAKTWVLPIELGGSWSYRGLWLVPDGTSQAFQPHVNPPNLVGSQTLKLQRGAAPLPSPLGCLPTALLTEDTIYYVKDVKLTQARFWFINQLFFLSRTGFTKTNI